jgi:hypothetical protein
MGLQDPDYDTDAITALAFRLTWPGEARTVAEPVLVRRGNRILFAAADNGRGPVKKHGFIKNALARRKAEAAGAAGKRGRLAAMLLPRALRRKLAGRRQPLAGWPVALSVPTPGSLNPRQPSVKMTGGPLD